MDMRSIIQDWFDKWDEGDFLNLPITDDFSHTSPYGTIEGSKTYLDIVAANQDKFLGNTIIIHDELYDRLKGCVRYTVSKGSFSMEVTEWHYRRSETENIHSIVSYYNIEGEISEDRKIREYE